MGGEMAAIQRTASKVSNDIFSVFKWRRAAREDMNYNCCSESHQKATHPSDVVFYYVDPYEEDFVYLNTDLKSYGQGSIKKGTVESALTSLSLAVECANTSDEWLNKYVDDDSQGYNVRGLLFLYNHDHLYDKDFYQDVMKKVDMAKVKCAPNTKIHMLNPYQISDVVNIAYDIKAQIGSGFLPHPDNFLYYYPDLNLTRIKHPINSDTAATIEMITSPYIIIKHDKFMWGKEEKEDGYVIYYNQPGASSEEFVYFFDMLSSFQILTQGKKIKIRMSYINPHEDAPHNFERAKRKYSAHWLMGEEDRLFGKMEFDLIANTVTNY
ncbi:hypothetical protein ACJ8PD_28265, partial [Serratia sp. CY70267]